MTKGDVVNLELDSGSALVVAGALKARNLVVGGARVHVRGALALKNTLLGLGESGSVHVAGNLDARAVFLGGFDFSFGARLRAPVMDYVAENAAADFGPADDFKALIQRDVLVDGDVDVANLIRRVRLSGKTPLTSTANPSRVIIEKAIKKFVDKGKPALEIDRTLTGHDSYNKHVKDIPEALCALTELEVLKLDYNVIREIPEPFSQLVSLRELSLYGCHVSSVHESFGSLPNLERLDFSYCAGLPETFGDLQSLRWFRMFSSGKMELPSSISRLKNLETLVVSGGLGGRAEEYAELILQIEPLRRFEVDRELMDLLVPQLTRLKNLADLQLHIESFLKFDLDVSPFERLETIHFELRYQDIDDTLAARIVREVLNSRTLEELVLFGWCGVEMPEDAFTAVARLERLDMSFCDVTRLPESFYALPNLKSLLWRRCQLPEPVRARIREAFPDLDLDLREGL